VLHPTTTTTTSYTILSPKPSVIHKKRFHDDKDSNLIKILIISDFTPLEKNITINANFMDNLKKGHKNLFKKAEESSTFDACAFLKGDID